MMRKSRSDFDTFRSAVNADISITGTLLDIVASWYRNVEIVLPIPEMGLDEGERKQLAQEVATEMLQIVDNAISELERGADGEEILPAIAPKLDALWRELAGVYASVLNAAFREKMDGIDPEEVKHAIEAMIATMAQLSGDDEGSVRAHMRTDESTRAKLRQMGIDPDTL